TVNNLEINNHTEMHDDEHELLMVATSEGGNNPEVSDIHQKDVSRKISVTFLEFPTPKAKKGKLAYQNTIHLDDNQIGETNLDAVEECIEQEESNVSSNTLHAVANNNVISHKWFADVPALPNSIQGVMVNECS
ncbi:hypothetical protein ILUMI_10982, partial [Ignelater luminosus]